MKFLKLLLFFSICTLLSPLLAPPIYYGSLMGILFARLQQPLPTAVYPVYNTHLPYYPLTPLKTPDNDTTFQLLNKPQPQHPTIIIESSTLLTPLQVTIPLRTAEESPLQLYTPQELEAIRHIGQDSHLNKFTHK